MNKLWITTALIIGMLATGCSDDKNGSGDGPDPGQTAYSFQLSGGHLTETLIFEGTVDKSPGLFAGSTSIIVLDLDKQASNGDAILGQFIFGPEIGESGTYDAKEAEFSADISFPNEGVSYQLHPKEGSGSFTLNRDNEKRVIVEMDFDASPSNIGGRDLVFHLEGMIDSRERN